mmetsp:Transcript_30418/g.89620  ORF Transcript_30418/g.89620 Transcript_30418/m.89620 type:complete len:413 (+) Transcript_30418:267-1505(+)
MLRGRILGTRRHGRRTVYALRTDHRVHVCGRHARCAPADHRKRLRHPLAAAVAVGGLLRCDASARRRARRAPRGARRSGGAARVALDFAGQRVARGGPLDRRRSPLLGLNALRHVLCVRVLGVVHGLARAERRARGQQRPRVRLCGARLVPASRVHGPACRQGPLLLLWPDRLDRTLRRLAAAAPLPRAAAPPRRRLAKAAHHACAAAGGAKGTARARPPPRRRATVGQDDARTRHPPCRERRSVRLQWHRVRRLPPPHGRRTMRAPFRAHPSARAVAPPVGGHKRRLSAAVLSNRAQAAGVLLQCCFTSRASACPPTFCLVRCQPLDAAPHLHPSRRALTLRTSRCRARASRRTSSGGICATRVRRCAQPACGRRSWWRSSRASQRPPSRWPTSWAPRIRAGRSRRCGSPW